MKQTIVSKERSPIIIETTQCGSDACPDQLLVQFGVKMFCSTPDELGKLGMAFVEMGKKWEDAGAISGGLI